MNLKNTIIDFLQKNIPDLEGIYIFGSTTRNQQNNKSDVDIAFFSRKEISKLELFSLAAELAVLLKKDVDLIHLNTVSLVFQYEIVSTGERIFSRDIDSSEEFESLVFSQYFRFNEERKPLLMEIQKRQKIYG